MVASPRGRQFLRMSAACGGAVLLARDALAGAATGEWNSLAEADPALFAGRQEARFSVRQSQAPTQGGGLDKLLWSAGRAGAYPLSYENPHRSVLPHPGRGGGDERVVSIRSAAPRTWR